MKKTLLAVAVMLVLASCAFGAGHKVGVLEKLASSPEEFAKFAASKSEIFMSVSTQRPEFAFYKSLNEMILALNAGEIDEILLPEETAEYVMALHPEYVIRCVIIFRQTKVLMSFGFKAGNEELRDSFSKALAEMKKDGTLWTLEGKFMDNKNTALLEEKNILASEMESAGLEASAPVIFRHFDGGRVIRAAVTGDIPPMDYIAPDGKPQGYNAAILAEICGRLGLNAEIVNIDSGSRAAMLASGRADVVFWFEHYRGDDANIDVPEGVIVSEPYYEMDTFFHLGKE
ncbi:MAG: transporter substrate-binding domain-containing protein [Synergistaceae bacterium]|nr:transporter substrate-binding domain-containing protein [Synergistaceae bacterium]MBR0256880.1 transporter substrate-binding domain-containing protein [Synergistaceae bacterium]